jgi:hypothetical protein
MYAEVIRRFDGHSIMTMAPGYFGYPYAHEDDAQRAVRTGLEIVQEIAAFATSLERSASVQLAVQVGIHTGGVVVNVKGNDLQHASLPLAEAPPVAMQLHSLADINTVAISQATCQLVEGYFVCHPLGDFALEESSQPLTIYQVQRQTVAQSRFDVAIAKGLTPLVGRAQETALLLERWGQVQEGRGQVVFLSGEAGIGKSRLIQVLKERLAGERYVHLESRGSPYYQHSALQPVLEHLHRLVQWRHDETPEQKIFAWKQRSPPWSSAA